WFLYFARALIAFPGGFGTLDELFETLTLQQTMNIRNQIPVFLYGKRFWERLIDFDFLVEYGLISPGDRKLFQIVDSVPEAMEAMIPVLESQIQ
ncbi:MAG TPA: lysine decarboxylase, partial [Leptospiraceae bacterium]|nr:lysine decarboxylase [Leptospiraceae bacterium]